jgi:hypothetical protein
MGGPATRSARTLQLSPEQTRIGVPQVSATAATGKALRRPVKRGGNDKGALALPVVPVPVVPVPVPSALFADAPLSLLVVVEVVVANGAGC